MVSKCASNETPDTDTVNELESVEDGSVSRSTDARRNGNGTKDKKPPSGVTVDSSGSDDKDESDVENSTGGSNGSSSEDNNGDAIRSSDIQTESLLCPNGSYSDTQEKYLTDSMYKLLGMLNEYISRFGHFTGEPYPDQVEFFFPSEVDLADYFEDTMMEYRAEGRLQFEYTREVSSQGRITFYSKDLSEIINSFYIIPFRFLATLDRNVFCEASQENLLSYVESAYMRYGNENENRIEMANAPFKLATIGCVLKELGCSNIAVYITSEENAAPTSYTLIFRPNELVKKRLAIQYIITEIIGSLYERID